jgi:transcriptional regulator with XRE-family HTH domain
MNWPELIQDLRAAPMTQAQIAVFVGVDQSTISDLARGRTSKPSFETADKLRALHKRVQRRKQKAEA